ncbi:MAG: amidohydrolase family protein [Burkholderiaceae bacterium]|nr:amidohydrolase family protein [Burkholderiaceae bacterium]
MDQGHETLYRGGRIFLPDGHALDDHAVLTHGARIARVAPSAEFAGYAGQVVDTTDATLLPGLIDCHVHLLYAGEGHPSKVVADMGPGQVVVRALEHARATLAGGITAVRDCGGKDYLEFAVRDACNRRAFAGPTIRAAGRMICMTGGHGNMHGRVADGVDEVVKAVREQVHAGSDFVKIMATGGVMTRGVDPQDAHYSAEEMLAGIREAQRFHRPTASHAQGTEGILNATRGGITSIEHGIYLTDEAIEAMLERGTYLVPTLAAVTNIVRNPGAGIPEWAMAKAASVADSHRQSVRAFARAGGRIAMGTDSGTPYNLHGNNSDELAFMVEVGMTPVHALLAATVNAADLMRLPDEGRIQEGAFADFLIVSGDPLADIDRAARREHHKMVVKRGRPVAADAN